MKYDLVITGLPRSGTWSVWKFLGMHPQIASSIIKEPIWEWDEDPESYIRFYQPDSDTKVLADCTPVLTTYLWNNGYIKKLSKLPYISRVSCIYTLRDNPFDRMDSHIDLLLKSYFLKPGRWHELGFNKPQILDEDDNLIEDRLFYLCRQYLNDHLIIKKAEEFFGDNLFITKLESFECDRLWDFLELKSIPEQFPHHKNGLAFRDNIGFVTYLKKKKEFTDWFQLNIQEFNEIREESQRKLKEEYGFRFNTK